MGTDSLLSIVQMPAGVPVATFAIGKAGAKNAALFAAAMLGLGRSGAGGRVAAWRAAQTRERARHARMIAPGSTIGILGGGQLGRMLCVAAAQLGYRTHIYAPPGDEGDGTPAADVAAASTVAAWDDWDALDAFARAVDVATFEFENVPLATVRHLAARVPVRPGARAFEVAQDRLAEKRSRARSAGARRRFAAVDDLAGLRAALGEIGAPAILKTRRFGYDGKGQARIDVRGGCRGGVGAIGRVPRDPGGARGVRGANSRCWSRAGWTEHARFTTRRTTSMPGGILRRSRVPAPAG